jgi:hypothetical protein
MVVSQKFVWAHIPKTGGDSTSAMIQQLPRLVVLADHRWDEAKHMSLDKRRGSIEGKLLVANIRRLPSWALSHARHLARHGGWPKYEPLGFRPPEVVASESFGDYYLNEIVGDYEIDFWIRQEHLVDDLLRFLRTITTLTTDEEAAIRSVGRLNEQRRGWNPRRRSPERFFDQEHVDTLYASNPRWAEVERAVYG